MSGVRQQSERRRGTRGNIALIAAMAAIPLAAAAVYAVDVSGISNDRALLQAAVDGAALAGANELSVSSRGTDGVIDTARTFADSATVRLAELMPLDFTVEVDRQAGEVTVVGTAMRPSTFGGVGQAARQIRVSATAESMTQVPLCILSSRTGANTGMLVRDLARVSAPGCLVHANSAITVGSSALVSASLVQSAATASGPIMPSANSGALPIPDPFINMDLAPPTPCTGHEPDLRESGRRTLRLPRGVHCGDIRITGQATLELEPGEHWFMGELEMRGRSTLTGDDVVLIFGVDDEIDFGENSTVAISARLTGPFAGFLIATTRGNDEEFTIASNNVRELLGTIYIPDATLIVRTTGNVAQDSAWSVIVARQLLLEENPNLVINTNYVASGVPVPEGVGPTVGGAPRLTE